MHSQYGRYLDAGGSAETVSMSTSRSAAAGKKKTKCKLYTPLREEYLIFDLP